MTSDKILERIKTNGIQLLSRCTDEGNQCTINLVDWRSMISDYMGTEYIKFCIQRMYDSKGISSFVIKFGATEFGDSARVSFIEACEAYKASGITVYVNCTSEFEKSQFINAGLYYNEEPATKVEEVTDDSEYRRIEENINRLNGKNIIKTADNKDEEESDIKRVKEKASKLKYIKDIEDGAVRIFKNHCFKTIINKEDIAVLDVSKHFGQISRAQNVKYIQRAIEVHSKKSGKSKYVLNLGLIYIIDSIIPDFVKLVEYFSKANVEVAIKSTDPIASKLLAGYLGEYKQPRSIHDKFDFDTIPCIKAHDIVKVDTISRNNDKPWKRLLDYINENIKTPTNFDFTDVEIQDPYESTVFLKVLNNKNFYMTVHNNAQLCKRINMFAAIAAPTKNNEISRVRDITEEVTGVKTAEQLNIERFGEEMYKCIEVDSITNVASVNVFLKYDQLSSAKSISYMEYAISKHIETSGCNEYLIDCGNLSITKSIIEKLANLCESLKERGVNVDVNIEDKESSDNFKLTLAVGLNEYRAVDKELIINSKLKYGTVGVLVQYKETRGKDTFGRYGNGEVIKAVPAIFRGCTGHGDTLKLEFDEFKSRTFYPKEHWAYTHDNEFNELTQTKVSIGVSDIGLYNDFLGSRYHFTTPMQYSLSDYTKLTSVCSDVNSEDFGKGTTREYSRPEYIKAVLDDFYIDYNVEELDKCIVENAKILEKLKAEASRM